MAYRVQYRYAAVHLRQARQTAWLCGMYAKNGSIFLIILFSFALILADCEFIAKLKKENGGTACRSTLPLFERLSAKSPHFLFSDLELEVLLLDESKAALGVGCG